jgi:uncharacterized membrane protein YphA (DoxX/SURF4 family)
MDQTRRLLYLRVAIVAGAIAGMALSHKLWLSARFYPLSPVFPFLKPIPSPFHAILFGITLLALAACALTPRLIPIFATLAIVLVLCDQSRLQPWFYEYFFLILGVAFVSPNACRLMIASIYFWSGIQKMNTGFITDVFPWMLEPFLRHLPHSAEKLVHPLSVAAPFIEMAIGLALLSRKLRTGAIVAAVAMHVFILISLVGQNYNHVVWPWNIANAAITVILFWKFDEKVLEREGWFQVPAIALFTIAPLLSFFGYWDHYLSSAMYSSNGNRAMIYFSDKILGKFPDGVTDYARVETPELDSIDVNEWSAGELNVPPYPEIRIFKNIARQLCGYGDVTLSITSKAMVGSKSITGKSYTCAALKN